MRTLRNFSVLMIAFCLLFIPSGVYAQKSMVIGGNVIKANLSSAVLSNYQIQYERVTGPFQSVAIGFSISPNVKLPFGGSLSDAVGGDDDQIVKAIESIRFTRFSVTPEYRFYFGQKGAPGGFYLGTFARYTHMSMENIYPFTTDDGIEHEMEVKGTFNGYGAGAMIGIQWLLGSSITLDWWIIGPFIGVMNSKFDGVDNHPTDKLTPQQEADLEADINDVELPMWTVEADVQDMKATVDLKGPFYGARFMGLSFGFRF
ncbi:MAG: DUF3575 domain-containing protein [Bacteroidetes bacterium]|nr:MAG: DUF3575 domain-containing protein [Bacteroidota bacterium]